MPTSVPPAENVHKGRHYEFIKNATRVPFKTADVRRGRELAASGLNIEPWYTTAPSRHHKKLKAANLDAWRSQNQVDKALENLQDLYSFAAPLLQQKLKAQYAVEDDVKTTCLRLYMPKELPWYAIDVVKGVTARTVSLLDAALHNFAASEQADVASDYITRPDERGHFDVLPIKSKMSIQQFQVLCRELDIGALYRKHLERVLLPAEPVAKTVLQQKVIASQKDALQVAAQLALTTKDLQYDAYKLIRDLAEDKPALLLDGKHMGCGGLSMMGTPLSGILLIAPLQLERKGIGRIVVYVPHDPDHPLKEYASPDAFMTELARQLREDKMGAATQRSYRQFFSQYVDHQERGHFFADLENRLFEVRHHEQDDRTDQRPAWRKEPRPRPHLQFERLPVPKDYWKNAYQQKLNKMLNDARVIAVSTADTDTKERWAWWDNFKKIVSDIFNVALFVATPFVPGLGELMLAYTAYQLTSDVIEGIVDLAEGQAFEAGEHVISVVTDLIQLAAFQAATDIGNVFKLKLSSLVDGMRLVKGPSGTATLWHPDLVPYEQPDLALPEHSKPDEHGLHRHLERDILPLEGKLYVVEKTSPEPTSRKHTIKHPTRPEAYSPRVEHNGHGAWVHEADNPLDWDVDTLMRRLGHTVEPFSPTELEQIRVSSGTEEDALRAMYAANAAPAPVLADTIKRFSAFHDIQTASANIRAGRPIAPLSLWFESLMTGLPGWPAERALTVFERTDLSGASRTYGNASATPANTLSIGLDDVMSGLLPERVVAFLSDAQLETLLGREVPPAERTQRLRTLLADAVDRRRSELAKRVYQAGERSDKAQVRLLKQSFPDLPLSLSEKLLADARPAELRRMTDENRLPLRLKTEARELDFEAGIARAYDGFYRAEQWLADTERLALNTLKLHTDTFGDLRVEVRDATYDGTLRSSVGPEDASSVFKLIRNEHGQYEVLDADNKLLHAAGDFYESILRSLPEKQRAALGYQPGQGRLLKLWIMEQCAPAAERRTLLAEPPIRPVASIETLNLVRGPVLSKAPKTPQAKVRNLYPELSEVEVERFVEALRAKGDFEQGIERLADELDALRTLLQMWEDNQLPDVDSDQVGSLDNRYDFMQNGGRFIKERLLKCFERRSHRFEARASHPDGGYALNLSSDLLGPDLDTWWKDLRERPGIAKYLDQISALNLDNARFTPGADGLLGDFRHLRTLTIVNAGLTEVPSVIGSMQTLEVLSLPDNNLRLPADSAKQWQGLSRLKTLRLDGNPLRHAPDVSALPDLRVLRLANTGIEEWPTGLFSDATGEQNRPRDFYLDLRDCPIKSLPDVSPGSDQAFILARTRLTTIELPDAVLSRLGDYRESVGFAREQTYLPPAVEELSHWSRTPEDESSVFSPSSIYTMDRDEFWQDLMAEPNSESFFKVIRKLRDSADFQDIDARRQLTDRVWQMIETAALDTDLREELFKQARFPETCGDGVSQLFNSMGMKVLVTKARMESTTAAQLDASLVKLARSAARLAIVDEIARAEIKSQKKRNKADPRNLPPDDIVVHLAFETGLAKRLDLPWYSETMLYRARSAVTDAMIETAYATVIEREAGDGLVNGMIGLFENPFWDQYLRETYPAEFAQNVRLFAQKLDWLEDLRKAQTDWANAQEPKSLNALQRKLEQLARQLNVAEVDVFSGEPMSTAFYNRVVSQLGYERDGMARRLTRDALAKVGV